MEMSSSAGDESVVQDEKQLPSFLDVAFLQRILEENLTEQEDPVRVDGFTGSVATRPGDNYSSDVFNILVRYNDRKQIKLVVKIVADDKTIISFGASLNVFGKEVHTFRHLFPIFSRIVSGADGTSAVRFGARCFYATREPRDTIVFEDLKALGYRMPDRTRGGLDFAHCELIMRKIGLFHAASMVYVARGPTERQLFAERYSHTMIRPGDSERNNPVLVMFGSGIDKFLEVSVDWPELDPAIRQKLQALKPDYVRRLAKSLQAEDADESLCYRVLNHGDLWINNMMFRYEDEADETTVQEVMFVDYQLSSYSSPGIDLVYSIYNCPRLEVRENRNEELLQIYHRSLCEGLRTGGYRLTVPAFADVQTEFARHEFIGLVSGLSMLPIILMERTDEVKLTFENMVGAEDSDKIRTIQYRGKKYRQSVIPLLNRLYAKGLLD
uniref:CHK kinase-like domain-containing protein n=1 Tax=Anopheles farauti TaxID=69004 RepID=A0A182QVV9_9DIPT